MEILIAVFIGLWLSGFSVWGYFRLKKDYEEVDTKMTNDGRND